MKDKILNQLNYWVEQSEKQAIISGESNMEVAKISSEAMAQAYWNVKNFVELNFKLIEK